MHCGFPFPDARSNTLARAPVLLQPATESNLRTLVVITTLPRRNPRKFEPRIYHPRLSEFVHSLRPLSTVTKRHCAWCSRTVLRAFCVFFAIYTPTNNVKSARASHGLKAGFAATRYGKDEHGHGASAMAVRGQRRATHVVRELGAGAERYGLSWGANRDTERAWVYSGASSTRSEQNRRPRREGTTVPTPKAKRQRLTLTTISTVDYSTANSAIRCCEGIGVQVRRNGGSELGPDWSATIDDRLIDGTILARYG
ncbi:hypothetical protein EDB87DRAFT_1576777 [Lactarius vividus]|nr:hypothetical protein EDB87DRAFT_1576777 [Lactarius vividus]